MKIDIIEIRNQLLNKLMTFQSDHYNENTYNFSQGYKRCLSDLLNELESYLK